MSEHDERDGRARHSEGEGRRDRDPTPNGEEVDDAVAGLGELFSDRVPPDSLETSIVGSLVADGTLLAEAPQSHRASGAHLQRRWVFQLAAALALLALGWAGGRFIPGVSAGGEPGYMMLLWEDGSFSPEGSPEAIASEYAAWAEDVSAAGATTTGNELALTRSFAGEQPAANSEGPEGAPVIGGYFLVSADDEATVRALAEAHPHVRYGGWIEVAPIIVR